MPVVKFKASLPHANIFELKLTSFFVNAQPLCKTKLIKGKQRKGMLKRFNSKFKQKKLI